MRGAGCCVVDGRAKSKRVSVQTCPACDKKPKALLHRPLSTGFHPATLRGVQNERLASRTAASTCASHDAPSLAPRMYRTDRTYFLTAVHAVLTERINSAILPQLRRVERGSRASQLLRGTRQLQGQRGERGAPHRESRCAEKWNNSYTFSLL